MTMFSAEERRFSGSGGYGGGAFGVMSQQYNVYCSSSEANYCNIIGSSDHLVNVCGMAEDESRTESDLNESSSKLDQREEELIRDDHEGWLKLSIGGGGHGSHEQEIKNVEEDRMMIRKDDGLVELELLPSTTTSNINVNNMMSSSSTHSSQQMMLMMRPNYIHQEFRAPNPRPVMNFGTTTTTTTPIMTGFSTPNSSSFFLQQQYHQGTSTSTSTSNYSGFVPQEFNWGFRPIIPMINIATATNSSSLSSTSLMAPAGSYFSRPFQLYPAGLDMAASQTGPSLDFRVIPPPRRPHSGIWFMLQASHIQEKEPFLPQISKSYLRIKDGRMTIRLVIKYLVNKLTLENESEIEIRCNGQRLVPFLTLQHVRDTIWSGRDNFITLLPNTSTTDHIMVLHYGRIASN